MMRSMILMTVAMFCAFLVTRGSATADCHNGVCRNKVFHQSHNRTVKKTRHRTSHSYGSSGTSTRGVRRERRSEYGSHGG